jgi:hypothetical protein
MIFGLFRVDQIFCVFDRACAGKPQNDRVALVNLGVPSEARRSEDRDHPSLIFSFPGDGTDFRLLLRNLLSACGGFDFRWSTHIFSVYHIIVRELSQYTKNRDQPLQIAARTVPLSESRIPLVGHSPFHFSWLSVALEEKILSSFVARALLKVLERQNLWN